MRSDTLKNIKLYEKALPGMKEKVITAAAMLIIACIVITSATYAWITLSTAPEVTGLETKVVANGNLEIALANGTGSAPGKSAAGDSVGAGTDITVANTKWGNVVNLSDESYGLANIVLRPAALNGTTGLLNNPLYGVGYGEDGRATQMTTQDDFAFAYYDKGHDKFRVDTESDHLGVRAVSTVKYENLSGVSASAELWRLTNQSITMAKNEYANMTNESKEPGKGYIKSLESIMQIFAQAKLDQVDVNTKPLNKDDVVNLYNMATHLFEKVYMNTATAYLRLADISTLVNNGNTSCGETVDSLCDKAKSNKLPAYITSDLPGLKQFAIDYTYLRDTCLRTSSTGDYSDLTDAQKNSSLAYWAYAAEHGVTVYFSNINAIINYMVSINTCTLNGIPLHSLGASSASSILGNSNNKAVITQGLLQRIEKCTGAKMSSKVTIRVKYIVSMDVSATVTTSAEEPFDYTAANENLKAKDSGNYKGTDPVSQDTYALALDFWLRTNSGSNNPDRGTTDTETSTEDGVNYTTVTKNVPETSFLTLEGTILTEEQEQEAFVKDINGDEQPAYIAKPKNNSEDEGYEIYERNGIKYIIINDDNGELTEIQFSEFCRRNDISESNFNIARKITLKTVVIGYNGENRVWSDGQMGPYDGEGTSMTQGGGSCYVFYANTPADQTRFLELLKSMKVAFIDRNGRLIGKADMAVDSYFAESGRVTVPLVLDASSAKELGTDAHGNPVYGLMKMEKNVSTRVSAIVYLDGTNLTNDMVLASGDIQGTLNVQFSTESVTEITTVKDGDDGSHSETVKYTMDGTNNVAIPDIDIMQKRISVNASVSKDNFEYDPAVPAKTTVTATVTGAQPKKVTASFTRAISSTQGVLGEEFEFTESGNSWTKEYTFEKPGKYILRSLWIDGVEYALEEQIEVNVVGTSVKNVYVAAITDGTRRASIFTAANSYRTDMTLDFTTSKSMPSAVRGQYVSEDGKIIFVNFTYKNNTWKGTADFPTSGIFTMKYVEIDGEIYEIDEELRPTLEVVLGLRADVSISASDATIQALRGINPNAVPTNFTLGSDPVTLNVEMQILDNSGKEIKGMEDVKLYYSKAGTVLGGLDGNMVWDTSAQKYVGSFNITKAGNYSFKQVTIGTNQITAYKTASNIKAMPPDDTYYLDNHSESYVFAPNDNAMMTLGIAYSEAARITAEISNGSTTEVVEGVMGMEDTDHIDANNKSVNLWNFTIPKVNDSQDGVWKLNNITMYDVYYNGVEHSGENGAVVDLTSENITVDVVSRIYVTLKGKSQNFNGNFMTNNNVTGFTATIADRDGNAIKGAAIGTPTLKYHLNSSAVKLDSDYGYESSAIGSIQVDAEGTLKSGSKTEYNIGTMNFKIAGPYNSCDFNFTVNGTSYKNTSKNVICTWYDNGAMSETCPKFDVKWNTPDVRWIWSTLSYKECQVRQNNTTKYQLKLWVNDYDGKLNDFKNLSYTSTGTGGRDNASGYYLLAYMNHTWIKLLGRYLDYIEPLKAEITLSGLGSNYKNATLDLICQRNDDKQANYTFTPSAQSVKNNLGAKQSNKLADDTFWDLGFAYAEFITVTDSSNNTYKIKLSHPIYLNYYGTTG